MRIISLNNRELPNWRNQIERLLNSAVKLNFPDQVLPESYGRDRCEELAEYLQAKKAVVFLAVDGETMLGWIWCHPIRRMSKERLHVAEIAVAEGHRGQGVGARLLAQAEQYARENGIEELDLLVTAKNRSAVSFYEKKGFEVERYLMKKTC